MADSEEMDDSMFQAAKKVIVEGAGVEAVNGTYTLIGIHEGRGKYQKDGIWNGKNTKFTLYYFQSCAWFISIWSSDREGDREDNYSAGDYDLYSAPEPRGHPSSNPPMQGWNAVGHGQNPAPTVSVAGAPIKKVLTLEPVAAAYKEMLLSEEFSDVSLVCEDKDVVPAHRNILAASSPYFKAAFATHWKNGRSGELNVKHSSKTVQKVISMLYTGELESEAIKDNPLAFMSISTEWDLPWLKQVAETSCSKAIDERNLKDTWQAARLYDSDVVKKACLQYAKENAVTLLADVAELASLISDDPSSWQEFSEGLRKKARHE